ncbi:SCO7613 C-terminal domain-containing membrane protein [Streptomyces sp. NPDC088730]|uniref:SCO7613 C-terminal domain-containing membrane protein n=1 Tax=Streptomyces sp. NPDC088730 TaxID=3365877 RepID=UPI0038036305
MEHLPPPAEELALLDRELAGLDLRRSQLLHRRAWLLNALRTPGPPITAPPASAFAAPFAAPARPAAAGVRTGGAQNVLLTLGGLLLTVAAIAFTLVSWGQMGISGRTAVLATLTLAALAAPAALLRRGLASTAEALAALASVLMVLDAFALHELAAPGTGALGFAATAAAVLSVLWAAYGLLLGGLRLPLPASVLCAQLPLLLWACAERADALVFSAALLATAALDCAIAVRGKRVAVRVTACAALCATGGAGLLIALGKSLAADAPSGAVPSGALLLAGAAIALSGARRAPAAAAVAGGLVAGLAAVAAVASVVAAGVPGGWVVPVYLLCGGALLAAVRAPLGRPAGRGLAWASGAVTAASVLFSLPPVAVSLVGPVSRLGRVWTDAPRDGARGALGATGLPWTDLGAAPVILLVVAGALAAAYRWWEAALRWAGPALSPGPSVRGAVGAVAAVLGWAGITVLPAALDVSYAATVAVQLVLAVGVFAVAVGGLRQSTTGVSVGGLRHGTTGVALTASVCGAVGAVDVALLSLASEAATYTVLGALLVLCAVAAVALDASVAGGPRPGRVVRAAQAVAACAAVGCAVVLTVACGASLGLAAHRAAPLVLAAPALTVLLGARLKAHAVALPVELAGGAAAVPAIGMAAGDLPFLALVLSLCAVQAAGTALRPERRPVAGYLATGLFLAAAWVRLSASGVSSPEAYTLPVTVAALVIGALRRRRDPAASSWTAHGAGLAATLVPSLFAAWADPHWLRPLLLGAAALVITLAGARWRLQALLVLGGAALALDAVHELAPYVVQVVGALPRWVAPALAGVVLLAVGATYEKRLRDARRLRSVLGRMR